MSRRWLNTAIASAAIITLIPAAADAGQQHWSSVSIDAPPGNYGQLQDFSITCASATSCFSAVSTQDDQDAADGGYSGAYVEHWDGTKFALMDSGVPNTSALSDITCLTPSDCLMVGTSYGANRSPLIDQWNGSAWKPVTTPSVTDDAWLTAIGCSSSTNCLAVGAQQPTTKTQHAFAERWNGHTWAVTHIPAPSGQSQDELLGVQCPSAHLCVVIGDENEIAKPRAFSETWNGTSWRIQSMPAPNSGSLTDAHDLTCPSKTDCFTAGYAQANQGAPYTRALPLIYRWNGTRWTITKLPATVTNHVHVLSDMTCPSMTSCVAVGFDHNAAGTYVPAAIQWDGTAWSLATFPAPNQSAYLDTVGCWRRTRCLAIGWQWTDASETQLAPIAASAPAPE